MKLVLTALSVAGLAAMTAMPVFAASHEDPLVMSCQDFLAGDNDMMMNMSGSVDKAMMAENMSAEDKAKMDAMSEADKMKMAEEEKMKMEAETAAMTAEQKAEKMKMAEESMARVKAACEAHGDMTVMEAMKRS